MRDDPRLRHLPIAVTVGKRPIDNFMVEKGDSTKEVRLKFLYLNRNMLCVNRVAKDKKEFVLPTKILTLILNYKEEICSVT